MSHGVHPPHVPWDVNSADMVGVAARPNEGLLIMLAVRFAKHMHEAVIALKQYSWVRRLGGHRLLRAKNER